MAQARGVDACTVRRIWNEHGLQPHRQQTLQLLRDGQLVPKLPDAARVYLNPPQSAVVLRVDEKGQIPTLVRTRSGDRGIFRVLQSRSQALHLTGAREGYPRQDRALQTARGGNPAPLHRAPHTEEGRLNCVWSFTRHYTAVVHNEHGYSRTSTIRMNFFLFAHR